MLLNLNILRIVSEKTAVVKLLQVIVLMGWREFYVNVMMWL